MLLVDRDTHFRTALAENLRDDGHEVHGCDAPSALPPLSTLRNIAAVITEYEMEGQDGLRFAEQFNATYPSVPIIMVTAYWTRLLEAQVAAHSFLSLIRKPVRYDELHELLHALTARPGD